MRKSVSVLLVALVATLALSLFAGFGVAAQSGKSATGTADSAPEITQPEGGVLWDQTDTITNTGALGIYDLDDPVTWAVQGADDFVIPTGEYWEIDSVTAAGFYNFLINPASTTRFYIYEDNGGLPGTEVYSYVFSAPSNDAAGTLTLTMEETVILPEGTYWMSVQPEMDFFTDGEWYWFMREAQNGNEFAWQNPGDGYGSGCTSWDYSSNCGFGFPDLAFQISGSLFVPTDVSLTGLGGEAAGANLWVFAALLAVVGFSGALVYRRSRQI